MKVILFILTTLQASASPCLHEFSQLEMRCLSDINVPLLQQKFKEYNFDKLPREQRVDAAQVLINSFILTCMEEEMRK